MSFKPKRNAFLDILDLMAAAQKDCVKIEVEGYMPLCVEHIGTWGPSGTGRKCVSFAHYGEQNGDAMRDPEVCFEICTAEGGEVYLFAYEFRNDYAGALFCAFGEAEDGTVTLDRKQAQQLNLFACMWADNLAEQGFVQAAFTQLCMEKFNAPT